MKLTPTLSPSEADPELLRRLALAAHIGLLAIGALALACITIWAISPVGRVLPAGWELMNADSAFCVLFSAASMYLIEQRKSAAMRRAALVFAGVVALLAGAVLLEYYFAVHLGVDLLTLSKQASTGLLSPRLSLKAASGFELLSLFTLLLETRQRLATMIADFLTFLLLLLVLVAVSEYLFGAMPVFGLANGSGTSPLTLFCLFLLAQVAVFRSARQGVFSILLGSGIGSRIARMFSPILLVMPFLREAGRANLMSVHRLPAVFATAILASLTAVISVILLLVITWRINGMERQIHNLSLLDELTGLHNLRGFSLLAEQALRLAQRSKAPFSVLFIDLDNLKQINDMHGHGAGSAALSETAEILRTTFRETDVLGRIGGDEFAVAAQFSDAAIGVATQRLREACERGNRELERRVALSFCVGQVTSGPGENSSLEDLLAKADAAMYEEKQRKKTGRK